MGAVTSERAPAPAPSGERRIGRQPLAVPNAGRSRLTAEIWIVLGVSLGQSTVYSVISLLAKLTQGPLRGQTATLNPSASPRPYFDLTYQLVGIVFTLVPVALALWLLAGDRSDVPVTRRLGLDRTQPLADLGAGLLLAAVIGLPGLGLYLLGHAMGITATVVPAALNQYWWTLPVLVLQAVKNAVLEEVIVVGYLVTRLRQLGIGPWAATGLSALLRGSYHLYQGFGPFLGNAVMGVVFAEWFRRRGRILPLIVAHTVLDTVSFVGYDLLKPVLHLS
ncbi:MAG: CPBP family intramembrane glutamic endopeptidase [Kineosporiaceae bacterium]